MEKLLAFFKNDQGSLAEALGLSNSMISQCKKGNRKLSPSKSRLAEKLTKGAVTKEQLRPDIFGD